MKYGGLNILSLSLMALFFLLFHGQAVQAQSASASPNPLSARADMMSAQNNLDNANIELANSREDMANTLEDAYMKSEDAIHSKADQLFQTSSVGSNIQNGATPQLVFPYVSQIIQVEIAQKRIAAEKNLRDWRAALDAIDPSVADLALYVSSAKKYMSQIRDLLAESSYILDYIQPDATFTQYVLRNWKSDIYIARSNVSSAVKSLLVAEKRLKQAVGKASLESYLFKLRQAPASGRNVSAQTIK